MIKLVILGHGQPVKLIINSLNRNDFSVVNVEQDVIRTGDEQSDFEDFLKKHDIALNKLSTLKASDYNLVLSMNYNKIINVRDFSGIKIVNLHIGLLPKYRGNNANAWAVLNNEKRLGYTLHEVTNILDAGDIYYKFEYDITNDENYFNAKKANDFDIATNISDNLLKIFKNELLPVSQEGSSFVYCTKIRVADSIIDNWNVNSELLIKKSYVFGKPLGTGLKFKHNDVLFELDRIGPIKNFESSIGIPGCIVYIRENKLWVKTKDTAVELSGIKYNNSIIDVNKVFKIGMRLHNLLSELNKNTSPGKPNFLNEQRKYFETTNYDYEKEYLDLPFEDKLREYRKKNVIKNLKAFSHSSILEIGCGPEPLFMDFTDFDKMVVIEPGKVFYKMANSMARNATNVFVINDAIENLTDKLGSETFDFIVIGGFLHEILNPVKILETIHKICSNNTVVYSFVPNARSFHRLLAYKMGLIENIYQKSEHDVIFERQSVFDMDSFNELFSRNKFNIIESGSYFVKPFTHDQMNELLKYKIINKSFLDGLEKMIEYLPGMGTELWNICKIDD